MASFDWHSLATLSRLARELTVPAKRLLVRPPRRLTGVWYLCAGRLINELTGERLVAGSKRCLLPVYPGHASLHCVSAVRLLYFDDHAATEFGLYGAFNADSKARNNEVALSECYPGRPAATDTDWIEALAGSPVLRMLYQRHGASGWQRWLRALEPVAVARGEPVVQPGNETECFYVVQSGVAFVDAADTDRARPLARVFAGGFFGEDAVLTGRERNARVHMPFGGRVLRGHGDQLRGLVADVWWALARNSENLGQSNTLFQIGQDQEAQALRLQLDALAKPEAYGVRLSDDNALLSLAVLLLMHRGYRVVLRDLPDRTSVMQTL